MSKKTLPPPPARKLSAADVGDLVLAGHRLAHVREALAANGVSKATADKMIETAIDDLIDDSSRLDENARRGWLLAAAKSIYRRQVEMGDLTGAATTIKMMGGLKRPLSRAEITEQAAALELYSVHAPNFDA
jgi:hypothetical protein